MHPLMVIILLSAGFWLAACAAKAKRGIGARFGFFCVGVVIFILVMGSIGVIWSKTGVMAKALIKMDDMTATLLYEVLPTSILHLLFGMLLIKVLKPKNSEHV